MAWGTEVQVEAVLSDYHTAQIDEKLRAMLGFLEKLTLEPEQVDAKDITPLHQVGLTDEAIEDAIHACVLFNIYDRLADSFDFHIPGPGAFRKGAVNLLRRGYQ